MNSILSSDAKDITHKLRGLPSSLQETISTWRSWRRNATTTTIPSKSTAGWGPAHFACVLHSKDALTHLHDRGHDLGAPARKTAKDLNYSATLPVHVCASSGFNSGIHALFSLQYDLDATDRAGESCLDKALQNNKVLGTKYLSSNVRFYTCTAA